MKVRSPNQKLFICPFSVFTFTWYSLKSISLSLSKSVYGIWSFTHWSWTKRLWFIFLYLPYTFSHTFIYFEFVSVWAAISEFHGNLNSCKHFTRPISLSSVHLKRAREFKIFIFLKINKKFVRMHYQIFILDLKMSIIWKI